MEWKYYKFYDKATFPPLNQDILITYEDDEGNNIVGVGFFSYGKKYGGYYILIRNNNLQWYYDSRFIAWMQIPKPAKYI